MASVQHAPNFGPSSATTGVRRISSNGLNYLSTELRRPLGFLQQRNKLFKLPIEIRIKIFTHLVVAHGGLLRHTPLHQSFSQSYSETEHRKYPLDLSILQVSKAIRKECLDIFYESNTFRITPVYYCHCPRYNCVDGLSMGNIQHLAIKLERTELFRQRTDDSAFRRFIDAIANPRNMPFIKSITMILTPTVFSTCLRALAETEESTSNDAPKGLSFLEYSASKLNRVKSIRLQASTLYHQLDAIRQIEFASRHPILKRCVEEMYAVFGGEMTLDDISVRGNRVLMEKLPFPLSCCTFNHEMVNQALFSHWEKTLLLQRLIDTLGSGCESLAESDHGSKLAGTAFDSPMANPFVLHQINMALCEAKKCLTALDKSLRKSNLTEEEMEHQISVWHDRVDSCLQRLPDPRTLTTAVLRMFRSMAVWVVPEPIDTLRYRPDWSHGWTEFL